MIPDTKDLIGKLVDVRGPENVEVEIDRTRGIVYVSVNGLIVFRGYDCKAISLSCVEKRGE